MDTDLLKESPKGRLSWVITLLEVIVVIMYLIIGLKGIVMACMSFDFVGMFDSVRIAIWFLVFATMIITALCFVPCFKSKSNVRVAIWNIIWMLFTIYTLI